MSDEIRNFFERYRDAFNALNGRAVAELYAEPSGIAQDGFYTHWENQRAVQQNMVALCELYRQRGFMRADFDLVQYFDQGPNHAVVELQWCIDWTAGQAPWQFNTSYNLLRTSRGWRVLLCTAYAEAALHRAQESGAA